VTLILTIATVGQAMVSIRNVSSVVDPRSTVLRSGSVEIWQDDFINTSKIDPAF